MKTLLIRGHKLVFHRKRFVQHKVFTNAKKAVLFKHILNWVNFPEKAKNVPIGKNCRRGRPRNTESALNRQNDDTESSGTSTSSNAEKSPDTNKMLNELGLGDSNTENKSKDSNDTVNDQDNDMNTGQVSEINEFESDLIDREGYVE